jgi:hypothetical protein
VWWRRRWKTLATIFVAASTAALATVLTGALTAGMSYLQSVVAADPPAPLPPLTAAVEVNTLPDGRCAGYVIDRRPADMPPAPQNRDEFHRWATALGGVSAGFTSLRITLQGRSETAVVLRGLGVTVTQRTGRPRGEQYLMESGCGGAIPPRSFHIELDAKAPRVEPLARMDEKFEPIPPVGFPYRISATEPEVFLVSASAERATYDWYLDLNWSSDGRTGVVRIDDRGHVFRTASTGDELGTIYEYNVGQHRDRPSGWAVGGE